MLNTGHPCWKICVQRSSKIALVEGTIVGALGVLGVPEALGVPEQTSEFFHSDAIVTHELTRAAGVEFVPARSLCS